MTHYVETKFGFEFDAAEVTRTLSDDRFGVVIAIATKAGQVVHVRVTPGGRIRVGAVGKRRLVKRRKGIEVIVGAPIP